MAGLNVNLDLASKVNAIAEGWTEFTERDFARALQFSLTGVGIDAVNRWRRAAPGVMDHPTPWILNGVRYDVDKSRLASIQTVDQAVAVVRVLPDRSAVMKYGFGEGHRPAGGVGIEGWFENLSQIYLPVQSGLERGAGIRPNAFGNYSGRRVKALAQQFAAGYQRNVTASSKWRPSQMQTYVHGAMVQVVSRTNSALWRAFADGIPPGVAPGADPRWGRVSVEATNDIRFHHAGPMLDGAILGGGVVT
ncbi:hypothetical protein GOFOIKOB_0316 [Methylobacterium tardum]|jgi:hypothetical protein|uniref:Uncharacterized protein n=1 Tax=Methylobacterium tardum TaxID=374432 RepID=A0AA37THL2_9HYPH|nr:hypothetical protein [Methylobacterium tardum]URD36860.1 hypothetical protein M6G65_31930 [Methylobacterium tardum]GJE47295.1 hypothetical protein GOFOIKOB_0316 [Methylobacterium tardum]GLS71333.1 hypothetical protein GCM10007890_33460 [Methylobacterium tardum]